MKPATLFKKEALEHTMPPSFMDGLMKSVHT